MFVRRRPEALIRTGPSACRYRRNDSVHAPPPRRSAAWSPGSAVLGARPATAGSFARSRGGVSSRANHRPKRRRDALVAVDPAAPVSDPPRPPRSDPAAPYIDQLLERVPRCGMTSGISGPAGDEGLLEQAFAGDDLVLSGGFDGGKGSTAQQQARRIRRWPRTATTHGRRGPSGAPVARTTIVARSGATPCARTILARGRPCSSGNDLAEDGRLSSWCRSASIAVRLIDGVGRAAASARRPVAVRRRGRRSAGGPPREVSRRGLSYGEGVRGPGRRPRGPPLCGALLGTRGPFGRPFVVPVASRAISHEPILRQPPPTLPIAGVLDRDATLREPSRSRSEGGQSRAARAAAHQASRGPRFFGSSAVRLPRGARRAPGRVAGAGRATRSASWVESDRPSIRRLNPARARQRRPVRARFRGRRRARPERLRHGSAAGRSASSGRSSRIAVNAATSASRRSTALAAALRDSPSG